MAREPQIERTPPLSIDEKQPDKTDETAPLPISLGGKKTKSALILGRIARALEISNRPLRERLQLTFNSDSLAVAATLKTNDEVDQLISSLTEMKGLLPSTTEADEDVDG